MCLIAAETDAWRTLPGVMPEHTSKPGCRDLVVEGGTRPGTGAKPPCGRKAGLLDPSAILAVRDIRPVARLPAPRTRDAAPDIDAPRLR